MEKYVLHNSGRSGAGKSVAPLDASSSYLDHVKSPLIQLEFDVMKAMIISHHIYPSLTSAFLSCQKVGCTKETIDDLTRNAQEVESKQKVSIALNIKHPIQDLELDLFMEGYEKALVKCKEELERPLMEAKEFIQKANSQLNSLTNGASMHFFSPAALYSVDQNENCYMEEQEEEQVQDEMELPSADSSLEKQEIKEYLLKKYNRICLSGLSQELSKTKKKKTKLPKEARAKLLSWWDLHNRWPYPSEAEKNELAQWTGLDQKQINNWFINQRKRHWTPSHEMQLKMANISQSHAAMCTYMGGHFASSGI